MAYQKKMFEMITRESLDAVMKDGEAITSRIKKAVANNDFLSIMAVFQVIRHLNTLQPSVDRTLDGSDATLRSKYKAMVDAFDYAGSMALDGFIDNIRTDGTTKEKMPKDGTVFQLTSNVHPVPGTVAGLCRNHFSGVDTRHDLQSDVAETSQEDLCQ